MSLATLRARLTTKVSEMQTLKEAFDYVPDEFTKYPVSTVEVAGGEGLSRSTAHNLQSRNFSVKVYVEKGTNFDSQKAERISVEVYDELETALANDVTLSGIAQYVQPISFDASYEDRGPNMRLLDITVETQELISTKR